MISASVKKCKKMPPLQDKITGNWNYRSQCNSNLIYEVVYGKKESKKNELISYYDAPLTVNNGSGLSPEFLYFLVFGTKPLGI